MIVTRIFTTAIHCRAQGCRVLASYQLRDGARLSFCCTKPAHLAELLRAMNTTTSAP